MGHNARMTGTAASDQDTLARRELQAADWAADTLGLPRVELHAVSGDASFRRYFRLRARGQTLILMDAPPEQEDSAPFVDIAGRLRSAGLHAPAVFHFDLQRGFGLLEDFGDTLYRELLDESSVDRIFPELFDVLEGMVRRVDTAGLPDYDGHRLRSEMDLFVDWYLRRHRQRQLSARESAEWDSVCERLIESAHGQPQAFVHKDFHSCNLLQTASGPGLIDFQDAVRGPVSYDLVSLVWDRYISWPRERLESWMLQLRPRLAPQLSAEEWLRCCDWMGLQRNLKIVGIFARLRYRDRKTGYLEMIPRFYRYLLDVLPRYPEFAEFLRLVEAAECAP